MTEGDDSKKNISTNQIVYTLNEGDGNGKDDEEEEADNSSESVS